MVIDTSAVARTMRLCAVATTVSLTMGCLSPHYTVRRAELERLANAAPAARTEVRAKQRIVFSAPPESLEPEAMLRDAAEAAEVARMAAAAVSVARDVAREADEAVSDKRDEAKQEESADKKKKEEEKKRDDGTALVVVVVIVGGVFIGAALAGSEGARFDGRIAMSAEHPLHLRGALGEIGWVPASKLTPSMLAGVEDAVISERDGVLTRLERAPLDRRGFTYGVELGVGGMNTVARDLRVGFAGRLGVGFFPSQSVGILGGANLQVGPKGSQETAVDVRPHVELQVLPVHGGGWHAGVYGEGGRSFGSERLASGVEQSSSSWSAGGGLLVQRELTTLLALVLRGGAVALPDPGPALLWSPSISVGVAVY